MSHVATINIEIKDLDALTAAAAQLGLELVRGVSRYRWFGTLVEKNTPLPTGFTEQDLGKCDHVIRIPNNNVAYEIGVCQRRDGKPGYQLMWDYWLNGYGIVRAVGGATAPKLIQEYSAQVAMKDLMRKGYRTRLERKEDGRILVQATK
jgi:hypothetical protein